MTRRKEQPEGDILTTVTLRADREVIRTAKEKARAEGRSLGAVFRKMLTDWLSGQYKPYENN